MRIVNIWSIIWIINFLTNLSICLMKSSFRPISCLVLEPWAKLGYSWEIQPAVDFPWCSQQPWGCPGSVSLREQRERFNQQCFSLQDSRQRIVSSEMPLELCSWHCAGKFICVTQEVQGIHFSDSVGSTFVRNQIPVRSPSLSPKVFKTNSFCYARSENTKAPNPAMRKQGQSSRISVKWQVEHKDMESFFR